MPDQKKNEAQVSEDEVKSTPETLDQGLPPSSQSDVSLSQPHTPLKVEQPMRLPDTAPVSVISKENAVTIDFSKFVHEYIREYISLADQKAAFFFAASTALLAFLHNERISDHWLKPFQTWNWLDVIAMSAMLALAFAALLSLAVIIPRTGGPKTGFIFWEAIADRKNAQQYAEEVSGLSNDKIVESKAEHCFVIAAICRRKYKLLRRALWAGVLGIYLLVVLFISQGK